MVSPKDSKMTNQSIIFKLDIGTLVIDEPSQIRRVLAMLPGLHSAGQLYCNHCGGRQIDSRGHNVCLGCGEIRLPSAP